MRDDRVIAAIRPMPRTAPAGPVLLSARELGFSAGPHRLIDIPSLALCEGGPSLVMGPNGAGKSLLLRLLHGLVAPTRGRVEASPAARRDHQAMVFQRPVLLRRSVTANVDYALRAAGVPRAARPARVDAALAEGGLTARATQPARTLSGGEQQRLAVLRALATEPKILFLDEPTASLDPAATQAIEALLGAAAARGTKIVMVTHDIGQARRLASEVLFLHHGRIEEQTSADSFFDSPDSPQAAAYLAGELCL